MYLKNAMYWRYATKAYNKDKQLSAEQWENLQTCVQLAPSSYGLQPYQFIVIDNPALREQISQAAYTQPQITSASKLIVIAIENNLGKETVRRFIDRSAVIRNLDPGKLKEREEFINSRITALNSDEKTKWAEKQAYLAAGILIASAADAAIDATPLEGFISSKIDSILGLSEKNLKSTLLFAIGFRSDDDPYALDVKVRKPINELFLTV